MSTFTETNDENTSLVKPTKDKTKGKLEKKIDEAKESVKKAYQEGNPVVVGVSVFLTTVISAFSVYYTVVPLFRTAPTGDVSDGTGILHSASTNSAWYSAGSGAVLVLLIAIYIWASSTTFSLAFTSGKDSVIIGILAALALTLSFYYCFASAYDVLPNLFVLWTALVVLLGFGFMIYAVYQARKGTLLKESSPNLSGMESSDNKEKTEAAFEEKKKSRSRYIYGFSVLGVVSGIAVLVAHFNIYHKITARDAQINA